MAAGGGDDWRVGHVGQTGTDTQPARGDGLHSFSFCFSASTGGQREVKRDIKQREFCRC